MHESPTNKTEYDECLIHGICSISPALSYMQEITLVYLESLSFYLFELAKIGLFNEKIKNNIIEVFSGLATNIEYNEESLKSFIIKLYEDLFQAEEIYNRMCKSKNINPVKMPSLIKTSKNFNLDMIIQKGKKVIDKKDKSISENQKKMLSVLLIILKSSCLYIVELQELNIDVNEEFKELLYALSTMTFDNITIDKIDEIIQKSVRLDNELMHKTFNARKSEFGSLLQTEVSLSTKPGKAILVSGANMKELELVLQATQNKGIDVYTHGQMIVGHTFPKLKSYTHLVGHYGKGIEYCISDFSSFPGSIYLTKFALYNIGHLYHGRIFTGDKIAPKGITTIKDNNFEPLVQSALLAEGFTEPEENKNIKVGLIEEDYMKRVDNLTDIIKNKKLKHIIAIGVSDKSESQKQYFEKFLELVEDDCLIISASYTSDRINVLSVNIDYVFPFAYNTIKILKQRGLFADLNTTVFYTRCEPHTIPNLFMMRYAGIKNIYFGSCHPKLINPALIETLREKLNIKNYTTPQEDLKNILNTKE